MHLSLPTLRLTALGLCLGLSPAVVNADSFWYSAAPVTVTFGVETDPPGSTRLDELHVDLSFVGPAAPAAFALDRVDTEMLTNVVPLDPAFNHPYVNASTQRTFSDELLPFGLDFLDLADGQTYWELAQDPVAGQIFLGVNSYITSADLNRRALWNPGVAEQGAIIDGRWIVIDLIDAQMPSGGNFALYNLLFSPVIGFRDFLATADGLDAGDRLYFPSSGHAHYRWGFTQAGVYELTFQTSTFLEGGFAEWAALEGLSGSNADFTVDNESDRATAGLEYALGESANGYDPSLLPSAGVDGEHAILFVCLPFGQPDPGRHDIRYEVWARTGLDGPESLIASKEGNAAWVAHAGTVSLHEARRNHTVFAVRDAEVVSAAQPRFLRLAVTLIEAGP